MKRNLKHIVALLFACTLLQLVCIAQDVNVASTIDSNNIRIGDQVKLHLIATYHKGSTGIKIQWPVISDSVASKVKVVSKSKIDTIKVDSLHPSLQELKQDIIITCFDSGYYAIPPFTFLVNGDTSHPLQTEAIMLYVRTVAVDTTKAFKDIKGPESAPFSILEILPWIGLGALGLLVIVLIIYFIVRAANNKKPKEIIIDTPKIEPHVKALLALEDINTKKLWQEGKVKDYHSALTDVLRTYLDDRFGINAQEMITDEIMQSMRRIDIDGELKTKLKQILVLADLVKFAKEQPIPKEHEDSFTYAVNFVKSTMKQEVEKPAEPTPEAPQQTNTVQP